MENTEQMSKIQKLEGQVAHGFAGVKKDHVVNEVNWCLTQIKNMEQIIKQMELNQKQLEYCIRQRDEIDTRRANDFEKNQEFKNVIIPDLQLHIETVNQQLTSAMNTIKLLANYNGAGDRNTLQGLAQFHLENMEKTYSSEKVS